MLPLDDGGDSSKSVLRSIRISSRLASRLRSEAHERKVSVNSLVVSILEKYSEWDIMAEKFGFVQLSNETFSGIIEGLEEKELARIARETGRSVSKDILQFWFKDVTSETVLSYLQLMSHYQKLFTIDSSLIDGKFVIVLRHGFGERGTLWFSNFLSEVIRSNLRFSCAPEQTKSFLKFEIPVNPLATQGLASPNATDGFQIAR